MSLLLDALKRAELANEQQAKENEPSQDDTILPSEDIIEDVVVENESILTLEDESLSIEPTKPMESREVLELETIQETETQVLPSMSFIKENLSLTHSDNDAPKSQPAQQNNSEPKRPNSLGEFPPSPPIEPHQQASSVAAHTAPTPYQPKSKQSNAWFIGGNVLALIIIGTSGAYYFINALDQLSLDSNVSQVIPATTVAEDIAMHKDTTTATIKKLSATPVSTANESKNITPVTQSTAVKKSANPKPSKTHLQQPRLAAPPVETNTAKAERQKTPLTILRKKRIDPLQELLQRAYSAYVNSDYNVANQLYQKALGLKNNNRDALLGLAIIAHRNKQPTQARRYYRKILSLNPKDSQAAAGLIALAQGSNATESESRLKLLLEHEPQAAHLHFTLGNQYVSQARWADAQQAFFQAYHADPTNADYAVNLAVSLDHIKQPQAALQYYRLALQLAQGKNVSFNVLEVAARIRTISQDSQP